MDCPPTSSRTRRRRDKSATPLQPKPDNFRERHNRKRRQGCQCAKRPMLGALAAIAADMRMMVLRGAAPPLRQERREDHEAAFGGHDRRVRGGRPRSSPRAHPAQAGTSASFPKAPISISMRRRRRPVGPARSHRSAAANCSKRSSPPSTAPAARWRRRRSSRPSARTALIRRSAAPAVRTRTPVSAATTIRSSAASARRRLERLHLRGLRVRAVRFDRSHRSRASVTRSRSWAQASSSYWRAR